MPPVPTAAAAADWVAESTRLFDEDSPFRVAVTPGDSRLVVVTGQNASGKSLFVRAVGARYGQQDALAVSVSIRERAGGGLRASLMFGSETDQSTGAASAKVVQAGFANLDRPNGSVLILDEPELGLSDGYASALGEYIADAAARVPDVCGGVVVVTHSRALVTGLLDGRAASGAPAPTWVHLYPADEAGPPWASLAGWSAAVERRSVAELLALGELNQSRFRAVHALLTGD